MMPVIIKGMKMPKNCETCEYQTKGVCFASGVNKGIITIRRMDKERPDWCPLVELPEKHLLKGEWLRMSDLSETDDNRYKCSRCGNVIHHKSRMDLYTFNSWCGRCGSDNSRHTTVIEADKWKEDAPTVIEAEGE